MAKSTRQKPNNLKRANQKQRKSLASIDQHPVLDIYVYSNAQQNALSAHLTTKNTPDKIVIEIEKIAQQSSSEKELAVSIRSTINQFLLSLCCLQKSIDSLDLDISDSGFAKQLIAVVEQQPQLITSDGGLIQKSHPSHKKLGENYFKMLSVLLSDKTDIVFNSPILDILGALICDLSASKMRYFRSLAVELVSPLISRTIRFFTKEEQADRTTKVNKMKRFATKMYREVLLERVKDVDLGIRKNILNVLYTVFTESPKDFLNTQQLQQVYGKLLKESQSSAELALQALSKLFKKQAEAAQKRILIEFAQEIQNDVFRIIETYPKLASQCLEFLHDLCVLSPDASPSPPKIDQILIQLASETSSSRNLKGCVCLMLAGPSVTQEGKLVKDLPGKELASECIQRLATPLAFQDELKIKIFSIVVKQRFQNHNLEDLFVMLLEKSIIRQGDVCEMNGSQVSGMANFLSAFMQVASSVCSKEDFEVAANTYNKTLVCSCKQLFYETIPKHPECTHSLIQLFGHLKLPLPSALQSYNQLIVSQLLDIFSKTSSQIVVIQIVKALQVISPQSLSRLPELLDEQALAVQFNRNQVGKFAAMLSIYNCNFTTAQAMGRQDKILQGLMSALHEQPELDVQIQMNILSILNRSHSWRFKLVSTEPQESTFVKYVNLRNEFMEWLFSLIRSPQYHERLRQSVFKCICNNLCLIYNDALAEYFVFYFDLTEQMTITLLRYLKEVALDKRDDNIQELFDHLSLEDNEVSPVQKSVLHEFLEICRSSVRFTLSNSILQLVFAVLQNNNLRPLVTDSLKHMVLAEISQGSDQCFVFWRLFKQFLRLLKNKEDDYVTPLVKHLVDLYMKIPISGNNKELSAKRLNNKLILFIADLIETGFAELNGNMFLTVKLILGKCHKRLDRLNFIKLRSQFNQLEESLSQEQKGFKKNNYVLAVKKKLAGPNKPQKQRESNERKEAQANSQSESEKEDQDDSHNNVRSVRRNRRRNKNQAPPSQAKSRAQSEDDDASVADSQKSQKQDLELGRRPDKSSMKKQVSQRRRILSERKKEREASKSKPRRRQ